MSTAIVTPPDDPALPQLAVALNPPAMAAAFGNALRTPWQLHVSSCRIERVKYRPRRNVTVSYRLRLHDERRGFDLEQIVAARFCADGESARRHRKALSRPTRGSAAGPALLHLPELDMLAHWLPNDAKLDAVAELCDDTRLRTRWLPELVAALTAGRGRLVTHRATLAQYVPEHRACARIELQLRPAPDSPLATCTVYAKADAEQRGPATHAVMQALHRSAAQHAGRLCTPRPVLWQAESGLHWQAAVGGQALFDLSPQVAPAAAARVAMQLAALHATAVPVARELGSSELRQRPHEVAQLLGIVEPAWLDALLGIAGALQTKCARIAEQPQATLHGDLHPRNILVDGEHLALIDLDSVRRGPAPIDLGSWVADTLYRAELAGAPRAAALQSARAFVAAYAAASGSAVCERQLAWSTAYALLCQRAWRCVVNLKPGHYAVVPRLLVLARSILGSGTIDAALDTGAPAPAPAFEHGTDR